MQINYTVKGQGNKNIILLHGWGGSLQSLAPLQTELVKTDGYRVYNIELPGFGESKMIEDEGFAFEDYVEALARFIENFDVHKPVLVGHSFGGKIAIGYTLKYQDKLSKLVLINASGIKPKNSLKKIVLFLPTKLFGALFSLPILNKLKSPLRTMYYKFVVRERDNLVSESMQKTLKRVLGVNFDDELRQIKTETLLIWSEADSYTPLWMGQAMAELFPAARLEVVKDAKHNLPLKNPEFVSTMIRLFIK